MHSYDYLEEYYNKSYSIDDDWREYLVEVMNAESELINVSIENNIVTENLKGLIVAGGIIAGGFLFGKKIAEMIDGIFSKFKAKAKAQEEVYFLKGGKLIGQVTNEQWAKLTVPNLTQTNFNLDISFIDSLLREVDIGKNIDEDDIKELTTSDAVSKHGEFGKILVNDKTFAESVKIKLLGTDNEEGKSYSGNELKRIVLEMIHFGTSYNDNVGKLGGLITKYKNQLNYIDNALKQAGNTSEKPVQDSYCVIENCMWSESSVKYCYNFNTIMEADDNGPKNTVVMDKDDDETAVKGKSTSVLKYLKEATNLVNIALTTTMTVFESSLKIAQKVCLDIAKNTYPDEFKEMMSETKVEKEKEINEEKDKKREEQAKKVKEKAKKVKGFFTKNKK